MSLGLNLRFDLRKQSDAHLAALLQRCWERYQAGEQAAAPVSLKTSWRGPIRHPLAYPFISFLTFGYGIGMRGGLAVSLSLGGAIDRRLGAVINMHLALCDIADINDELNRRKRRVTFRRAD
jgi:hypothetical protein